MTMQPDTRKLLRTGLAIFGTGAFAALLVFTVFGGKGRQGPHTNLGWLALMLTVMGCLPTGSTDAGAGNHEMLFGDRHRS